jgi:broad specificity phosphatase PhoE
MQLLIVRHGESVDDVINAYGGWADFPLSNRGQLQLEGSAANIKGLNIPFEKILTSPLQRAQESAQILAKTLKLQVEVFEYLKERNTYGILSGMNKDEAKEKYPWLVEDYEKGGYVDGSEREDDIKSRVDKAYQLILKRPEQNLIIVTHGVFLKTFAYKVLGRQLTKKEDGGFMLLQTSPLNVLLQKGIEVS